MKHLRRLSLFALALLALWLAGSYVAAYRLTRRARPLHAEPTPAVTWGDIQPVRLTTADGHQLGAWSVAGRRDRPVVLLLHGNGADRSSCLEQAEFLAEEGCPVLLVSQRCHGDSTGEVNDFGHSGRHDVKAAVAWIERNHPGAPVVVWGRSLGAAAALFASGELGERVGAYILECPYKDLRAAVRNRMRVYLPWPLDVAGYAGLMTVSPLVLTDIDAISPLAAADVPEGTPVLVLAGSQDRRAPADEARAIAERIAGAEVEVLEGGHLELDARRVRESVRSLLANVRPRANARSRALLLVEGRLADIALAVRLAPRGRREQRPLAARRAD